MIDEVGQFPPQPVRDVHWDIGIPSELPYTVASLPFRGSVPETASFGITVPIAEQQIVEEEDLYKSQVCFAYLLIWMFDNILSIFRILFKMLSNK